MLETSDLYPGISLYTPQLVHKNYFDDISELSYNSKFFGTEKVDGYWECLIKENNKVYMFARSKSKIQGWYTEKINYVKHLRDWAMDCLPNGTMLIGEIYVPGGTSKDVTSILGCKEDKAWNRQVSKNKMLCFYVHDILKYNGVDYVAEGYSNDKRISLLYENIDLKTPLIPQVFITNYLDGVYVDFEQALERIFDHNGEGIVFKEKDALYMPGKRNKSMFKIKQDAGNDLDFIVTGFVEPEKVYTGKEIES